MDESVFSRVVADLRARYGDREVDYDLLDLLFRHATALDAFMYAELFWPRFVEVDGMVFWHGSAAAEQPDFVADLLARAGGNRTVVERGLNYIPVSEQFGNPDPTGDTDEEQDEQLAIILKEMWSAKLAQVYADRQFRVELVQANATTGAESGITFFEVRT